MVNTIALFDVPSKVDRRRLESLLRQHEFVWLFPFGRWSSKPLSRHRSLVRAIRRSLDNTPYRVLLIEMKESERMNGIWLTAMKNH